MTQKAREVLEDCRLALQMLEDETDMQRWRILWAAAAALIRAVGHVLDKVDGRNPSIKRVGGIFFKRWKQEPCHEIFRDFIEGERNSILKEYQSGVHPLEDVSVVVQMHLDPVNGGDPKVIAQTLDLDDNVYRPMLDGPWQGDDCRDVLREAIDWWSEQLDAIDVEVKRCEASTAEPGK